MDAYKFITDFDKVVAYFGIWPSFHDGEVQRLVFDRVTRSAAGISIPTIELTLRGWVMSPDVWKVAAEATIQILFDDVFDVELEGFNNQNVITAMNLATLNGADGTVESLHVELEHCFQFSCSFKARRAKVLSVQPVPLP